MQHPLPDLGALWNMSVKRIQNYTELSVILIKIIVLCQSNNYLFRPYLSISISPDENKGTRFHTLYMLYWAFIILEVIYRIRISLAFRGKIFNTFSIRFENNWISFIIALLSIYLCNCVYFLMCLKCYIV